MSRGEEVFITQVLDSQAFRSVGTGYPTFDEALGAVQFHYKNNPPGNHPDLAGGLDSLEFRVFRSEGDDGSALVQVMRNATAGHSVLAVYRIWKGNFPSKAPAAPQP
jgi:hypothetical protein